MVRRLASGGSPRSTVLYSSVQFSTAHTFVACSGQFFPFNVTTLQKSSYHDPMRSAESLINSFIRLGNGLRTETRTHLYRGVLRKVSYS